MTEKQDIHAHTYKIDIHHFEPINIIFVKWYFKKIKHWMCFFTKFF